MLIERRKAFFGGVSLMTLKRIDVGFCSSWVGEGRVTRTDEAERGLLGV